MSSIAARIKSIIVLNGNVPPADTFKIFLLPGTVLIAADGAAWALKKQNLIPDIIIGDLDSLRSREDPELNFPNTEIIEKPDQETNDFEKALRLVVARGLAPVMVIGMQGGDLEHSFNNWSVSIKLSQEIELWLLEQDRMGIGLNAGGYINAQCLNDKTISLIPQPDAFLTTTGLRWPLKDERLALGYREGARNEILENKFSVKVHSGSLLVFCGLESEIDELVVAEGKQSQS